MTHERRRSSLPQRTEPANWMEVAAPIVAKYLESIDECTCNQEYWDTWMLVCKSWAAVVTDSHSAASSRLLCDSSMELRIRLWNRVLGIPENIDPSDFADLVMEGSYASWAEISRDSRRTFASVLRKRPGLHLKLTRILHALSAQFRDVGYCQGMNFVAGTVLLALSGVEDRHIFRRDGPSHVATVSSCTRPQLPPSSSLSSPSKSAGTPPIPDSFLAVIQEKHHTEVEVLAFKICEKLFMRNHFVQVYELGWHTRMTIWTLDKLVESIFPALHAVITDLLQVSADFYASSWFITLFTADLDLKSSIRVMDLFIAKGPKALHRFGLACIDAQLGRLLESGSLGDPAEGLKVLRTVAATAVAERGVEELILTSCTKFKFVNNRLIADLARFGKLHGGALLVFVTDKESVDRRKTWLIVPAAEPALQEEQQEKKEHGRKFKFLSKFRRSKTKSEDLSAERGDGLLENSAAGSSGTTSPSRRRMEEKPSGTTFKSFRKKLGSLLPGSATRGYAKTGGSDF